MACERDDAHRTAVAAAFAAVAEAGALVAGPGFGAASAATVSYRRARRVCRRGRRNEADNGCRAKCGNNNGDHGLEHLGLSTVGRLVRWQVQRTADVLDAPDGVIDASVLNDCATL